MNKLNSIVALVGFFTMASYSHAHGPELKIDKTTAVPGEVITVQGEGITANGEIQLTLKGILRDYSLGSLQGGEHGGFEKQFTLPSDIQPGSYILVASGDDTATVKLEVKLGAESEMAHGEEAEEPHGASEQAHGKEGGLTGEANAGEMHIERKRTTVEWIFGWGTVLLSSSLGVGLLRRRDWKV